jgi:hypothetical protein
MNREARLGGIESHIAPTVVQGGLVTDVNVAL